jgi:hypothetical protein
MIIVSLSEAIAPSCSNVEARDLGLVADLSAKAQEDRNELLGEDRKFWLSVLYTVNSPIAPPHVDGFWIADM